MIHLVGPGGAGKSTTGALLARRLGLPFVDLDDEFMTVVDGGIDGYIDERGYLLYAARNVELYLELADSVACSSVFALSSGFMTYPIDVHPEYAAHRERIASSALTFVLLPALDYEVCVAEIVRRQLERPFARSSTREEEVIRERFWLYAALAARKVETMRAPEAVVTEMEVDVAAQLALAPDACFARAGEAQIS